MAGEPSANAVEYYIGVESADTIDGQVWIEADEYEALKRVVAELISMTRQTHVILVRVHGALHSAVQRAQVALTSRDQRGISPPDLYDAVSLALVNWLLNLHLFLDHSAHTLSEEFGRDSEQVAKFHNVRRHEHHTHFGFRVMYELRNYCTHRGPPPIELDAGRHRDATHFNLTIDPRLLSADRKLNANLRRELAEVAAPLDVLPLVDEAMQCFDRLERYRLELFDPEQCRRARLVLDAAERVNGEGEPSLLCMEIRRHSATPHAYTPTRLPVALAREVLHNK